MKKALLITLILFSILEIKAQQRINTVLKQELDSIYVLDQKYRYLLSLSNDSKRADSIAKIYKISKEDLQSHLWSKQEKIDSTNLIRIEEIIKQYGYPGKTLVGAPTNEAAFFVVQHSPKISQYISFVKQAAKEGELPFTKYATMLDRLLMEEEKEQLYGTQVYGMRYTNPQTEKEEWKMFVWPIKNPEVVNDKRKQAGFEQTVEENARKFNLEYKVVTLEEVKKMRNK
ncbi:DUF6624 domain-containing protein [Desertivirga arenae]|uniref:DUF6624 domain-containing protein n=1 Tax=Desertivirga arenae TaxID=2810309 RepID=UPI001A964C0E|nr:DUF6624 domain-containing protein [Pedobacter sp. SYSU D00823]